ncbi:hypothetical protein [Nitrosococcus halophilus]|nr:hypothetical protein [Nitrosococcus halophilus]
MKWALLGGKDIGLPRQAFLPGGQVPPAPSWDGHSPVWSRQPQDQWGFL